MGILGMEALTLSDYRKRMNPDGSVDFIIEALERANPIMNHVKWIEGNLPTGNKTTLRTSIPRPSIRRINQGIVSHKSTTKQIQDTCMMLEDRSEVDVKLIRLQPNGEAFRRSEDAAFVAGFGDTVSDMLFYGDTQENPDTFNGLSIRYNIVGGEKHTAGHQVVAGGTPGTNTNTSAFFVSWGTKATTGIYPKNSQLGLSQKDLGEQDALDDKGHPYRALVTLFDMDCGLAVQDIEANALVRNIDVKTLDTLDSKKSLELIKKFVKAKNTIRNLQNRDKDTHLYVSPALYDFFEIYLLDKTNVHMTRQDLMNARPQLYFSGIPIEKSDSILETEPAFPVA